MSARRSSPTPDINVTPLVDVVLVLLIIFMVVVPKVQEKGVAVQLPPARNAEDRAEPKIKPAVVSVDAQGKLFLLDEQRGASAPRPDEELSEERLLQELVRSHEAEPRQGVVVKGDKAAPYKSVRRVFKACQELGFKGISLQVVEKKGS